MKKLLLMVLCAGLAIGLTACCCRSNNLKCCQKVECEKPCARPCPKKCARTCPKPCKKKRCGRSRCKSMKQDDEAMEMVDDKY